VRADQRDVVAQAQVAEAVGPEPLGVERAGQAQGAEAQRVGDGDAGPPHRPGEEQPVELRVVRADDGAVEQRGQSVRHLTHPRRAAEGPPGQTVDVPAAHWPPRGAEIGLPPVENCAVPGDADDADLQQPVTIRA